MRCGRCGERERAGKHAWCRECQREARNTSNARRQVGDATVAQTAERRVRNPEDEGAIPSGRARHDHAACHKELEALRAERDDLKRRLGIANQKLDGMKLTVVSPPVRVVADADASRRGSREIAASQNAHTATVTPHGAQCQGLCCR